jgi:hypothetical protein
MDGFRPSKTEADVRSLKGNLKGHLGLETDRKSSACLHTGSSNGTNGGFVPSQPRMSVGGAFMILSRCKGWPVLDQNDVSVLLIIGLYHGLILMMPH